MHGRNPEAARLSLRASGAQAHAHLLRPGAGRRAWDAYAMDVLLALPLPQPPTGSKYSSFRDVAVSPELRQVAVLLSDGVAVFRLPRTCDVGTGPAQLPVDHVKSWVWMNVRSMQFTGPVRRKDGSLRPYLLLVHVTSGGQDITAIDTSADAAHAADEDHALEMFAVCGCIIDFPALREKRIWEVRVCPHDGGQVAVLCETTDAVCVFVFKWQPKDQFGGAGWACVMETGTVKARWPRKMCLLRSAQGGLDIYILSYSMGWVVWAEGWQSIPPARDAEVTAEYKVQTGGLTSVPDLGMVHKKTDVSCGCCVRSILVTVSADDLAMGRMSYHRVAWLVAVTRGRARAALKVHTKAAATVSSKRRR